MQWVRATLTHGMKGTTFVNLDKCIRIERRSSGTHLLGWNGCVAVVVETPEELIAMVDADEVTGPSAEDLQS